MISNTYLRGSNYHTEGIPMASVNVNQVICGFLKRQHEGLRLYI